VNLESLPQLRVVEEARIGNSADPNLGFSIVSNMTVDRDGNVYVFDMPGMQVRVFSPRGAPLRMIGRKGEGPGEFEGSASISIWGDTLVAIGDGGGGCGSNIMLFNRNGTFLSSSLTPGVRVALQSGVGVVAPKLIRSDGKIVGHQTCFTGGDAPGAGTTKATDTVRVPRVLFDMKGVPVDTLGFDLRFPPGPRVRRDTLLIEGRRHPVPPAPSDAPLSIATLDGRVVIDRKAPQNVSQTVIRMTHVRMNGDTASTRVLRYAPKRYTAAVLDSFASQSARVPGGSYRIVDGVPQITPYANPAAAAAAIRARLSFPAYQTPVSQSFLAEDNAIWLAREDDGGAQRHWIIFDAQGRPRGRADLPRRARLGWASGTTLWIIYPDEDDVPWVIRYRIAS
jgi:hypothetical protein